MSQKIADLTLTANTASVQHNVMRVLKNVMSEPSICTLLIVMSLLLVLPSSPLNLLQKYNLLHHNLCAWQRQLLLVEPSPDSLPFPKFKVH